MAERIENKLLSADREFWSLVNKFQETGDFDLFLEFRSDMEELKNKIERSSIDAEKKEAFIREVEAKIYSVDSMTHSITF